MIPYFEYHTIPLGPVHIQVWGLLAAAGIVASVLLGRRESQQRGIDKEAFTDFAALLVLGGLIGGRLFHAFAYEPAAFIAHPLEIVKVWKGGLSFIGGFIGAAIAAVLVLRGSAYGASIKAKLAYANVACFVLPLGYAIARIGCFLIHDHPGTLSHSMLAVDFPSGPRLDLGLIQAIIGVAIFAVFAIINRRANQHPGTPEQREVERPSHLRLFLILYGATRFCTDFLRASDLTVTDTRYAGLTPAQWTSIAMVAIGALWPLLVRAAERRYTAQVTSKV